jgi:hypothetical protein
MSFSIIFRQSFTTASASSSNLAISGKSGQISPPTLTQPSPLKGEEDWDQVIVYFLGKMY